MAKFAAVLLLVALSATNSTADVMPQGPPPNVGSSVVISAGYTVHLFTVRTNRDGTLHVSLQITKKDPVHGDLVMEQTIPVGGALGVTEESNLDRLPGISPKLRLLLKGDAPVPFDPKAKLISVKQHAEWPIKVCLLTIVPEGWGCVELEKRLVSVTVNEIVLQDKSGKKFTLRNSSPPGRVPSDRICRVHGGSIPARMLTDAETQEARAVFQLESADEDWKSRNPRVRRRAQEAYRKLLKEFASTSFVAKNTERIKARAEAEIED